jgi:putative FmdB family regulatory protein
VPTYEYKCTACGYAFERFQSIKAAPIKKCPECGKSKVKRLIGMGAGLLFKGSGFYITDYRAESYNKAAKADAAPTSGSDAKPSGDAPGTPAAPRSDAKTDSTTPAKSEPKPAPKPEPKKASRSARN